MRREILFFSLIAGLSGLLVNVATPVIAQESVRSNTVITKVGDAPANERPNTGEVGAPKPPSETPGDLRAAIRDKFGITMDGFRDKQLRWAWDKLWTMSNTKFAQLVAGTLVEAVDIGSEQTGCKKIRVGLYDSQELFNVIFTHEMGHIIRNCTRRAESFWDEHLAVLKAEGPITNYARTVCSYKAPGAWEFESEDYAEMIAYYLNPQAGAQTHSCAGREKNPYLNGGMQKHFDIARKILGDYP